MKPRIYIAGASAELARVERAMAAARAQGWELTHDWTAEVRASPTPDHLLPSAAAREHARLDCRGVQAADVFWLLVPHRDAQSVGAWVELGLALAHRHTLVLASGARSRFSIFLTLATARGVDFDTAEEADAAALVVLDRWRRDGVWHPR